MCNIVSSVQISGFPVHQGTQEAKDGIVYSAPGWDIAYQRIQRTANHPTIKIQNIQSDLGLQRSAFLTELEDLDNELWLKEYKKKRRAHVQEIVYASILSEQVKDWMVEYSPQVKTDITCNDKEIRYE